MGRKPIFVMCFNIAKLLYSVYAYTYLTRAFDERVTD